MSYETGYLTPVRGGIPPWLESVAHKELDLRPRIANANTIVISDTHRIDRDAEGRLAMLTKVRYGVESDDDDLYHHLPPAAYC